MSTLDCVRDLRAVIGTRPINLVGAGAVVTNAHGHVLLCRRVGGSTWGVPTGIAELGEELEDTLVRELHEETGLTPRDPLLFTVISGPDTYVRLPNGDEFYQVTTVYVVREWNGSPRADGVEGHALGFFPLDALPVGLGPVDRRALERLRACLSVY